MRADTMSWAGPLPDEINPAAEQMWNATNTFEGPAGAFRIEPLMWAGPLPPVERQVRSAFRDKRRQFTAHAR